MIKVTKKIVYSLFHSLTMGTHSHFLITSFVVYELVEVLDSLPVDIRVRHCVRGNHTHIG